MARNAAYIDYLFGDEAENTFHNLPPLNPLGFLDLIPARTPSPNPQPRKRRQRPSTQPPQEIDRIRDQVNQWLGDDEFGAAGVPEPEPNLADVTGNMVDTDIPTDAYENTHDLVENLLAAHIEETELPPVEEPLPPDPIAESILHSSNTDINEDITNIDDQDENAIFETSSTLVDDTEEIFHIPKDLELSDFQNALGLWVNLHSISRSAYSHLIEVFQLAKDLDDVKTITPRHASLKAQVRKSLPLGKLRRSTVNLDMSRLPTRSKSTAKILSIDLEDTLSTYLSSKRVSDKIYKGMAHRTGSQVRNPWEAPWWGESVRTSSGKFHYYPNGDPIFPSDFVIWQCQSGLTDHGPDPCTVNCERTHVGRVVWSGLDMINVSKDSGQCGKPLLLVQRVYQRGSHIPFHLITLTAMMSISRCAPTAEELVIVEDSIIPLRPNQIIRRLSGVHLDYQFSTKDFRAEPQLLTAPFTIRYIWNESKMNVRELKYSSPHRAELELQAFGRHHFIKYFVGRNMFSLPLQMFVDAFGLFRTMYRSIEGIYFFPQFFDAEIRSKRSAVLTATLGPYGAQRADVFKTLFRTTNLDRGTELVVNGEKLFVCSFVSAVIGDMPSQQELSGCLGPTANFPCRYCLVPTQEKGDMQFDIDRFGKYHNQVLHDRERILSQSKVTSTRKTKLAGLGLSDNESLFSTMRSLFPALDIIRSRPIDAAHSEYAGISKYLHRLIFQEAASLLTRAAGQQAAEVFHNFPTPPGWPRFQSPRTHLDSYSMQEYARGIIVLPLFLRCWLKDHHIKPDLHKYIKSRARDYLDYRDLPITVHNHFSVADLVVVAVWAVTRSVLTTNSRIKSQAELGNYTPKSPNEVRDYVVAGRKAFQLLCQVQSDALQTKASVRAAAQNSKTQQEVQGAGRRRGQVPGRALSIITQLQSEAAFSQQSFGAPSESLRTTPTEKRRQANPEEKINQFLRWKQLPNVHSGLHLPEVAREYGSCTMVFTLLGEDMHKQYKALIYSTNCVDVAATLVSTNNLRKTIGFLLAGCYEKQLPRLHATYQKLRKECPRMSQALDPYLGAEGEEDADVSYLEISSDPSHKTPRAFLHVPRRVVAAREDPLLNVATAQDINSNREFFAMLCKASGEHYNMHMIDPGLSALRWWRKVAFTTSHGDRQTLGVGDYAKFYSSDRSVSSIARIDGIFTHQRTLSNYLYFFVSFTVARSGDGGHDPVLKLPYYDITGERSIIGLPQLGEERLWMVDLYEKGIVPVEHNVYFM